MPRPKSATAGKSAAGKKGATGSTAAQTKRSRRSPFELVQELRDQRDALRQTMEARLAKLDERIAKLETKHEHKIKVSELLANRSPEELARDLEALRAQHALLRKALKQ